MYIEIGNAHALEGYEDPAAGQGTLFREIPGEQVTRIVFPAGLGLQDAMATTLAAMTYHLDREHYPAWVESDSPGLVTLLTEHYSIQPSANIRPADWGSNPTRIQKD